MLKCYKHAQLSEENRENNEDTECMQKNEKELVYMRNKIPWKKNFTDKYFYQHLYDKLSKFSDLQ